MEATDVMSTLLVKGMRKEFEAVKRVTEGYLEKSFAIEELNNSWLKAAQDCAKLANRLKKASLKMRAAGMEKDAQEIDDLLRSMGVHSEQIAYAA